ncbi:hypothetical protein QE364_000174 [Nocardioides zeae]|uniref:Uncharacterized protein n=1 Tax=Nocardioides zeae TaxID=1457234 RepID=A0ACC6ICM7_9ACTN|nr:hypothetical protein [Nocardioides zeae]MDR6175555.1 hypothetical protein [Nocardioides zeae]MDR6208486.1 hypothetical protein [Nocardioides zeae]
MTTSTSTLRRHALAGGLGLAVAASLLATPVAGAAEPVQGDLSATFGTIGEVDFRNGVSTFVNVSGAVPAEQGGAPVQVVVAPAGLEDALATTEHRLPTPEWHRGRGFNVPSCAYTDPQRDYAVYAVQPDSPGVEGSQVELSLPEVDTSLLAAPEAPRFVVNAPTRWRYMEAAGPAWYPFVALNVVPEGVASWCGTLISTDDLTGESNTIERPVVRDKDEYDNTSGGFAHGLAYFPEDVPAGPHQATFTLDTDGRAGDGLTITHRMQVDRGQGWVGSSFRRLPSPTVTGLLRVQGLYSAVGPIANPQPGRMTVKLYSGTRGVWYSGIVQSHPRTVDWMFRLPKLPRGTYRAVIDHRGNSNVLPSTVTRTFTVR